MKGAQIDKRIKVLSQLLEVQSQGVVWSLVPQLPQYPAAPSASAPPLQAGPLPLCVSLGGCFALSLLTGTYFLRVRTTIMTGQTELPGQVTLTRYDPGPLWL